MNSQNDRYFFRGKRKDNAMWMHGSLVAFPNDNEHYGIWSENAQSYLWVMPDTIGQCTGLKDKNDKLIFEGDILAQATHNTTLITVARWSDGGWLNGGARECQYSS
ncbi:MAG: YopX family protein, partial [Defluviitaleaceae bacterium]|nr:YopX family protein [Defluviitaleaceae bacterium]